jgi:hypothetical protein
MSSARPPVRIDAGPSLADLDAADELPTSRLGCRDDLWRPGREWIEERTSSTTSVGPGGYMGQTWPGARKVKLRLEKKILAMKGDAITRLRVRFEVDRDPSRTDDESSDTPTELEGRAFIVTARGSEVGVDAVGSGERDREAAYIYRDDIATLVPEITGARWRGEGRALADRLRSHLGWSERASDAAPPWGNVVVTPAPAPRGALFADARAFAVTGDGHDESAGLGHWSTTSVHVSGRLLIRPDGTLVELQLTEHSAVTEGLNFGCGANQRSSCPGRRSATRTASESFRVLCGLP